jgi:hypothetical protein
VWELLGQDHEMEHIATIVARDYDIDLARATGDVAAIVANLIDAKLVEA